MKHPLVISVFSFVAPQATVPWGYYVVYPVLGLLVLCCCAGACCLGRQSAKEKRAQRAAKGGAEGQEGP